MFKIKNLHVSVDDKKILKDFNIDIKPGELHVIMGPNGSGKSTLTHAIAGKESYQVDSGDILLNEKSILDLDPEERVGEGVFVSFQYPTSLPGVNNVYFLKDLMYKITILNTIFRNNTFFIWTFLCQSENILWSYVVLSHTPLKLLIFHSNKLTFHNKSIVMERDDLEFFTIIVIIIGMIDDFNMNK